MEVKFCKFFVQWFQGIFQWALRDVADVCLPGMWWPRSPLGNHVNARYIDVPYQIMHSTCEKWINIYINGCGWWAWGTCNGYMNEWGTLWPKKETPF